MLDALRRGASTWVAKILFFLLVASFAVWGIGDIFRGGTATDVARVGDIGISANDYKREFDFTVQRLSRQTNGSFDSLQARQLGIDSQVLTSMIQRTALQLATEDMGLTISDDRLSEQIRNTEAFQSTFGQFSPETYRNILRENGLTPEMFEASLRTDLVRAQLLESITSGAVAPKAMAEALYEYRFEKRSVDYVVIAPDQAGDIPEPTEQQLKDYYSDNEPLFTAPEYRAFTLVRLEPADFKLKVEIDENEIQQNYEFSKDRFVTPERRTLQVLPFTDEAGARDAETKLKEGAEFDLLARSLGFDMETITFTDATEFDLNDTVVAKKAFELEKDAISEPVNGQLSWAIVRVTSITEAQEQSPEEAKATIRDELATELAKDVLYDSLGAFEDELAAGATLEEAAARVDVPALVVAAVDIQGETPEGTERTVLPKDIPGFLFDVFNADLDVNSEIFDTPSGGVYAFRVDKITDETIKPFDSLKDEVKSLYMKDEVATRLSKMAKDMVDAGNNGEDFEALAAKLGRSVLTTTPPMSRGYQSDIFSSTISGNLFASDPGKFLYGPVVLGGKFCGCCDPRGHHS